MRGVLVVGVTLSALAVAPAVWAGPATTPTLRARLRDGGVNVQWTYGGTAGPESALALERATDAVHFTALATVSKPRRRGTYADRPTSGGTYSYRARLTTADGTTPWSEVASATLDGTETPPTSGPPGDPPLPSGQVECPAGSVEQALALVNEARRAVNRPALQNDSHLARAARVHTIRMVASGKLTHDGWVSDIRNAGYGGGFLAENIAYGYQSPASVVQGWLNSSVHRGNMLNGYRDSGIGCVVDRRGRLWWTQDFGL